MYPTFGVSCILKLSHKEETRRTAAAPPTGFIFKGVREDTGDACSFLSRKKRTKRKQSDIILFRFAPCFPEYDCFLFAMKKRERLGLFPSRSLFSVRIWDDVYDPHPAIGFPCAFRAGHGHWSCPRA